MFILLTFFISIIGCFCIFLLIAPIFIPMDIVEQYSKIFSNFGIGMGALMGGLGGLSYIHGLLAQQIVNRKIKEIKNLYPDSQYSQKWDVVVSSNDKGKVFIRDLTKNIIHHVGNYPTYLDLGLGSFDRKEIPVEEFEKFSKGEPYRTREEQ